MPRRPARSRRPGGRGRPGTRGAVTRTSRSAWRPRRAPRRICPQESARVSSMRPAARRHGRPPAGSTRGTLDHELEREVGDQSNRAVGNGPSEANARRTRRGARRWALVLRIGRIVDPAISIAMTAAETRRDDGGESAGRCPPPGGRAPDRRGLGTGHQRCRLPTVSSTGQSRSGGRSARRAVPSSVGGPPPSNQARRTGSSACTRLPAPGSRSTISQRQTGASPSRPRSRRGRTGAPPADP
jgi:hypothetical protein